MDIELELKNNIVSLEELRKYLDIEVSDEMNKVLEKCPMSITRYYLSLIDKNDLNDPIRKLIIPHTDELNVSGNFDTSGESKSIKQRGLQHKYGPTALILSTNRCAAYCRFCFRKRLIGVSNEEILVDIREAIEYIKDHKEVNNVLITGGDSFVLSTTLIEKFLSELDDIKHLKCIRFGTRVPVVFPERIYDDEKLLDVLKKYNKIDRRLYVVTHFNHPNEITKESVRAIDALIRCGVVVNNQSVLMRGINDDSDVLAELFNGLVGIGVVPYYIFQCRPVRGVKNYFQVPIVEAYNIIEEAKKLLSGLGKRFRYIMSHDSGKIEILGIEGEDILFKYHQVRDAKDFGRIFRRKISSNGGWLDEFD